MKRRKMEGVSGAAFDRLFSRLSSASRWRLRRRAAAHLAGTQSSGFLPASRAFLTNDSWPSSSASEICHAAFTSLERVIWARVGGEGGKGR